MEDLEKRVEQLQRENKILKADRAYIGLGQKIIKRHKKERGEVYIGIASGSFLGLSSLYSAWYEATWNMPDYFMIGGHGLLSVFGALVVCASAYQVNDYSKKLRKLEAEQEMVPTSILLEGVDGF